MAYTTEQFRKFPGAQIATARYMGREIIQMRAPCAKNKTGHRSHRVPTPTAREVREANKWYWVDSPPAGMKRTRR